MAAPLADAFDPAEPRFRMSVRSTALGAILVVEALAHTLLVQSMPHIATSGFAQGLQNAERGLFRLLVAYAVFCAILAGSRASPSSAVPALPVPATASLRPRWFAVHVVSFAALLVLSFELHSNESAAAGRELGIAWLMCASLALAALFAALAPYALWNRAARSHRGVLLRAVLPAVATLAAIYLSQSLWRPAATLTFHVVATMLRPIAAGFTMDPDSLTLGTGRFLVTIADACSGLEGMGLMLVFSVSWLWFFRREFYFPRALMIIPAAVALMFLLNSVRIAALVLIGDAGYPNVAIVGFHSQAGWIAFNGVAFGVAWLAKRSVWLNRAAHTEAAARTENPTAPYLVPLLAVLAAGMVARALSAGFDFLYPLRLIAGGTALIAYRSAFGQIGWRMTWRGPVAGAAVFAFWSIWSIYMQEPRGEPLELARAPEAVQGIWIACRGLCAVLIVPLAEELAYRGYLMRVIRSRAFETLPLAAVGCPALLVSSVVFGASHGALWFPATVAGVAYGWLAMRTNSLGEAACAHAVTNALLALEVLLWGHWQLW